MTREEHLVLCKKCLNRKFDSQKGIVCELTGKIADFEGNCPNFKLDESIKEEIITEERSNVEIIAELSEELKDELRPHQVLSYAIIGGLFLSIICALIWAVITVSTEYQIGFMAIGVGIVVGMGVRFFGAGIDTIYGFIGAFFALLGCVLGNLFSQIGFVANAESIGYFHTLSLLDFDTIISIYEESFSGMDILFYGFAIFEGYKFAFRPIPSDIEEKEDFTPQYSKLRLPLVVTLFLIISFAGYTLSKGINGEQTFYYESGELMSSGEYKDSKMNGTWKYYYENGKPQVTAEYVNGIEKGNWEWYYENGQVMKKGVYSNGLIDGLWLHYYENGVLSDSSNYEKGRLTGESFTYYENGEIIQKGKFTRDRQDGLWKEFFDNGQLRSEGKYNLGEQTGLWKFWSLDGKPLQELEYRSSEDFKIINTWDKNGQVVVENGFGEYKSYYEDGTLQTSGIIKDSIKIDVWKNYHSNGKIIEEGVYEKDIYKVMNTWSTDGEPRIIDGEGDYISFYEGTTSIIEKGLINNGLREGIWKAYYPNSDMIRQESNYIQGQMHGKLVVYYENGNIYTEGNYENELKEGEWTWNYDSGYIQCSVNYVNDQKEGVQQFWSESGSKNKEEIYENGVLISEKIQ